MSLLRLVRPSRLGGVLLARAMGLPVVSRLPDMAFWSVEVDILDLGFVRERGGSRIS